ncbi:hypothetical protein GCM10025867_49410 (plasmid) [Frondihabitans sucicola]|uniref:TraD/TraG TraM recognition site domain-containing protein n=1 Tax=Frondihabitans sucicola TaxID=1268041 RepID=A0ABM8GW41_9MICO|nr:hypothetical protein GCM10025867_49410 [Frondihabitans sucicola]
MAATPRRIRTEIEVDELANWLRSSERNTPVVVVTTHFDKPVTRLNADKIAADLTGIAEVVILETGPHTERLAEVVGPMWGVFGSGGRIYPADTYWHHNPYFAPIFIRYTGTTGAKQSEEIIRRTINRDYGATSTRPVKDWDGPSMLGAERRPIDLDAVRREKAGRNYDKVPENRPAFTSSLGDSMDPLQAQVLRELALRSTEAAPEVVAPEVATSEPVRAELPQSPRRRRQ